MIHFINPLIPRNFTPLKRKVEMAGTLFLECIVYLSLTAHVASFCCKTAYNSVKARLITQHHKIYQSLKAAKAVYFGAVIGYIDAK